MAMVPGMLAAPVVVAAVAHQPTALTSAWTTCGLTTVAMTAAGTTPTPIAVAPMVPVPGTHAALAAVAAVVRQPTTLTCAWMITHGLTTVATTATGTTPTLEVAAPTVSVPTTLVAH